MTTIACDRTAKLAYLRIDDETRRLIRELQPRLCKLIPPSVDAFYAHIMKVDALAAMFGSEEGRKRARDAQLAHWQRMFSAEFDDEYIESVTRIGTVHCKLGLDVSWYIGGYSIVKQGLFEAIMLDALRGGPVGLGQRIRHAAKLVSAVERIITLDMDLGISVYLAAKEAEFSERLNRLSEEFGTAIAAISRTLASSAQELAGEADTLEQAAGSTSAEVEVANRSAEEAAANVQAVAAAIEELSASIAEISTQVNDAARGAGDAVTKASAMTTSVAELHETAEKVGGIIRLIEAIAQQTNLLALNATIEAARAGDAGKGFAVVAGEVKRLAQQTASATGEISAQIKAIQDAAFGVGAQIEAITGSITRMGESSSAIAGAVEEQTAVTREIARSVTETSNGVEAVLEAMRAVADAAQRTLGCAGALTATSTDVRGRAGELDEKARVFFDKIQSADRKRREAGTRQAG
jgi:methyl-accepting chemotaxis protein